VDHTKIGEIQNRTLRNQLKVGQVRSKLIKMI